MKISGIRSMMVMLTGLFLISLVCPWVTSAYPPPTTGLYFQLGTTVYISGQVISIYDIGEQSNDRAHSGSTLVCVTVNVNKECCRKKDGKNVGEWYYPDGQLVHRLGYEPNNDSFFRVGFAQQVRLTRTPSGIGPLGEYRCEVPDINGYNVSASIVLSDGHSAPPTGLYFQLNNFVYLPGESLNISDIGQQSNNRSDPGLTLVCVTININRRCCRRSDFDSFNRTRVSGDWYYPNGTIVSHLSFRNYSFRKFNYKHQLRLARTNSILGPLGPFTCKVPDEQGSISQASITISGMYDSYVTFSSSNSVVRPRQNVVFTCTAEDELFGSNPSFLLTTADNLEITSSSSGYIVNAISNTVRAVTLTSVLLSHAGQYACQIIGSGVSGQAVISLSVKLPTPLFVSVYPPHQPVYATSTRYMTFHVQLQPELNISTYIKIRWTSPIQSTQHFPVLQVNVTSKTSYASSISLSYLNLLDSGNYTCSVTLHSWEPYFVESDVIERSKLLTIQDVPAIKVTILSNSELVLGHHHILNCSHKSVEPNFIYTSSFEWHHSNGSILGQMSQELTLSSLSYSNAGNYTCKITATSVLLGSPIFVSSVPYRIILQAPSPSSIYLTVSPDLVFAGTSAQLICSAVFTGKIDVILTVTMEFRGPVGIVRKQAVMDSFVNFTGIHFIGDVRSYHAGNYSCSIISSGPFLIPSLSTSSNSVNLTVVGMPSAPRIITKNPFSSSVYFTWSVNQEEVIEYFELSYSYEIKDCHGLGGNERINVKKIARSYDLIGLEENSDVLVTLTAINTAGRSIPASFRTTTLKAAPTRGPANLRATSFTHSSISVSWEPVPCADRNTDITGYTLTYSTLNTKYHQNFSIHEQTYNATKLIPATKYRIVVVPNHDVHGQVAVSSFIEVNTSTIRNLQFFLNGSLLSNNSIVKLGTIGIEGLGLFCLTNSYNCCRPPFSAFAKGQWIFPNQSIVSAQSHEIVPFSRTRHSSSIILHHINFPSTPTGVFTCRIPDLTEEDNKELFIHIADDYPNLSIMELFYTREINILTCTSRGRPVNFYQWSKDSRVIEKYSTDFQQTQVLTDGSSAIYKHYLFSRNKTNLEGRFTCQVKDIYGISDSRTLMLNNCPAGQYGAVAFDGSTVCVTCPANSMSTSEGSNKCGCLQGYYRNDLEDYNFPCTRPPSKCRNLRVKELIPGSSALLQWTRPVITGRQDLYYNVYLSNPDNSDNFVIDNLEPVVSDFPNVEYTLSELQPLTFYKVKVFPYNGVSGKVDDAVVSEGMCDASWTTSSEFVGVPRSVSAVCGMVAWQVPASINEKTLTGYDIIFTTNTTSDTVLVSKNSDEHFHVIREKDWPDQNQKYQTSVKVRAKTESSKGAWSEILFLNCSSQCWSS